MPTTPFLTELDDRARVRGSRDPLGAQPLWGEVGRGLIGNLSTVSSSVRDFKVLLVGYWFVGRLAPLEDARSSLNVFLRWEQLASFSRALQGDTRFRGTDRVQKALADKPSHIRISADSAGQILSDQPRYGLWGLFSVPAQSSGLLDGAPRRLTPAATEFVEKHYLPVFDSNRESHSSRLLEGLAASKWPLATKGSDAQVFQVLGKLLVAPLSAAEREFYREHLLLGGPRNDKRAFQEVFAEVLSEGLETPGSAIAAGAQVPWRRRGCARSSLASPCWHRQPLCSTICSRITSSRWLPCWRRSGSAGVRGFHRCA